MDGPEVEGYVVAKVSLNCSRCTFKTAKLKKWKAKRRLSTHNRNDYQPIDMAYNGVAHTKNYQEIVQQESIEIVSPSTKVSLQCDICNFRTAWLRRSKAKQCLYNYRYSYSLIIDSAPKGGPIIEHFSSQLCLKCSMPTFISISSENTNDTKKL